MCLKCTSSRRIGTGLRDVQYLHGSICSCVLSGTDIGYKQLCAYDVRYCRADVPHALCGVWYWYSVCHYRYQSAVCSIGIAYATPDVLDDVSPSRPKHCLFCGTGIA
eukprot:1008438-Rhodomonas_salina.10